MKSIFAALVLLLASFMHTPRNIQSPYVAADFWTQYNSVNPRMTLFVLITPQSFWTGVSPLGFTSNTRDMTLPGHPGITFKSAPGITPTVIESSLGQPSQIELSGIYQTNSFVQTDVVAGKWNYASVEIFVASWQNTDLGELPEFKGNLGEFKDYQQYFTAEGRGPIAQLSNDTNIVSQKTCRVKDFGDTECGKVLTGSFNYDATTDVAGASVTETAHGMTTGETVRVTVVSGVINPGIAINTPYYIIRVDANTFKFASSYANAIAVTGITLTDAVGVIKVWRGVVDIGGVPYDITYSLTPDGSYAPNDTYLIVTNDTTGATFNPPENFFRNGKIIVNAGSNAGISREIAYSSATTTASGFQYVSLQLKRSFPFGLAGTESITVKAGCVRTLEDCRKYKNIERFRAEAFVPGIEAANRIPPGN